MSDDEGEDASDDRPNDDPLADRAADDSPTPRSDDAVDQWVEDVATDTEREHADDPFERIGEGTGPRHGDPFDAFEEDDEATGRDPSDVTGSEPADVTGSEPTDPDENESPDATDHPGLPQGPDTDEDPFREFDEPTTDPFGDGESTFAGTEVGEIDDDGVWERMESTDSEAEAVPGKRYVDVNKHSYCETCEHFSEPPDVSCSHEGTEILEFGDMETVRVVDCPIVAERKALEDVD